MRLLAGVIVVLALLYGGYWFVGAGAAERGALAALDRLQARGVVVQHGGVSVAGFPSRFDLTLTEPALSDPARGLGWSAAFAQVFSLSYKPWHLIAALPETQQITLPGQQLVLATTRMQGSLVMKPAPDLPLAALDAVAEGVSLRSDLGWALALASANLRLAEGEGGAYQLAVRALDVVPDQRLVAGTRLPETLERIDLLADVTFDRVPALRDGAAPVVQRVVVQEAHVIWGPVKLLAKGDLLADATGRAEGRLDLRIEGWQAALDAVQSLQLIPDRFLPLLTGVLTQMELASGEPGVIALPLTFQNGLASLGPVPLGPAPRLR